MKTVHHVMNTPDAAAGDNDPGEIRIAPRLACQILIALAAHPVAFFILEP